MNGYLALILTGHVPYLRAAGREPEGEDLLHTTIADALVMACHDGARVLRLDADLGDLAPGKLADLILIRTDSPHMQPVLNPMANVLYSAQAADVDSVICDGKPLMRGRKLLTLDKATIIAEVKSRINRLNQRVPGRRLQTYQT